MVYDKHIDYKTGEVGSRLQLDKAAQVIVVDACSMKGEADMRDVIRKAIITAQSARLLERNQYTFEVDLQATKPQIKSFVESTFRVKVISVNTHRLPNKKTRLGGLTGHKSRHKRAIVTIAWGDRIVLFPES